MTNLTRRIFRVKGWLEKNEFQQLLKFSDYIGRVGNEAIFEISSAKLEAHGMTLEEALDILREFGERINRDSIDLLEKNVLSSSNNMGRTIVIKEKGGTVILKPNFYMGELFKELRSQGLVFYDARSKTIYTYPGLVHRLVDVFSAKGVKIVDEDSLLTVPEMPHDIRFKGELREYQKEAIDKWSSKNYRGIIALPTGAGKTIIAIYALTILNATTLVVTFTKEQLRQWIEKIIELTDIPGGLVAAYYGEEKRMAPITVTTYQTAFRKLELFAKRFGFLIVDEVHHLPADKFKSIALGMYSKYRMGLSATVVREDGRHVDLFPLMGGIVYHKTPQELIDMGYLAPYITRIIRVELNNEEKKKYEELKQRFKTLSQGLEFKQLLERARKGDLKAINALRIHNKMKQLMHKSESKAKAVKEIVEQELTEGSKILVFTQYVDQAEELGKLLGAPVITGSVDTRVRKQILENFKRADNGVLILTTVGDEGLDIPDVNVGIIVAGTGSRRQFVQRLGRLLRPKPGKIAKLYEVVSKGTAEEYQTRKRKKIRLDEILQDSWDQGKRWSA